MHFKLFSIKPGFPVLLSSKSKANENQVKNIEPESQTTNYGIFADTQNKVKCSFFLSPCAHNQCGGSNVFPSVEDKEFGSDSN